MSDWSSMRALWALRDDLTLSAAEWRIAVLLVAFADERGTCHPGLTRLACSARTSRGAVRRSLRKLEQDAGPLELTVERNRTTTAGDSDSNRYQLKLRGWDQADPTGWDHRDPTPDQAAPTVGSPGSHRVGSPGSQGGIRQTPKEDPEEDHVEEDPEDDPREREVFEFWATTLWSKKHSKAPKLTEGRRKHIRARLKNHSVEEIKQAIRHVAADPFMLDGGYLEPENFMRTDEKLARWIVRKPPKASSVQRHGTDQQARLSWGRDKGAELTNGAADLGQQPDLPPT